VKLYFASKVQPHLPHWRAMRHVLTELGVDVVSSWLDFGPNDTGQEPSPDQWRTHWDKCISEAADADVLLFFAERDRTQCGALLEVGAALASGKQVFLVSDYEWTVSHHPLCRTFDSLEDALGAIIAMQRGTRLAGRRMYPSADDGGVRGLIHRQGRAPALRLGTQ